ncbi:hypothetical protein PM082_021278 [Marasmius tenuissimus]|nr:hypothetical protein PM082_021278 [Marasmius tenuissimus]
MAPPGPAALIQGPMFIGFIFNLFLLGFITLQCYIYGTTYKKDKLWMKYYVGILYLVNIVHTVLLLVYLYETLINNFGDVAGLLQANWFVTTDPLLTGLIATQVQLFFAWRIKVLTGSIWLALAVAAISMAGLAGAVASTALTVNIRITFPELQEFQTRRKTGWEASDMLVDRIIRSTIQTGALTSVCAIIDLILFLLIPTALHLTFNFTLAKLYTNTLLSSLNSRRGWGYNSGSSNSSSQRTGSEGITPTHTIGGTPIGGGIGRSKKTLSSTSGVVRVALQRPQEVFVNVAVESHELQDMNVISSRTRADANDLENGGTNGLKTGNTEYDASHWI